MKRVIEYFNIFYLYIVPIALILNLLTVGHWYVSFTHENKIYTSDRVYGFPFPSHGMFQPAQFYNSGDESYNYLFTTLNALTHLVLASILYFLLIKRFTYQKYYWRIIVPFLYLFLGGAAIILNFGFIGGKFDWFFDFKIIHYHFWCF